MASERRVTHRNSFFKGITHTARYSRIRGPELLTVSAGVRLYSSGIETTHVWNTRGLSNNGSLRDDDDDATR